jgi:hypothetical protein
MTKKDVKSVRFTITLRHEIYDKIKDIRHQLGLPPFTWIGMIAPSTADDIEMKMERESHDS